MKRDKTPPRTRVPEVLKGFWWVPVIFLNVALVVLVQCLVWHTIPGPLTWEKVQADPFFSGCTLLDLSGELRTGWQGTGRSSYVLYQDADGRQKVVRYDSNAVANRYGLARSSQRPVEQGCAQLPSYLGTSIVEVKDGRIGAVRTVGLLVRDQNTSLALVVIAALVLQGMEATLLSLWRKARRKN